MSSKAHTSKKRSQQLKRNPKRKTSGEEVALSKKEVMKIPSSSSRTLFFFKIFKIYLFIYFREGGGRERGRETSVCVCRLPLACPQPGTWPATKACASVVNQMGSLSVCRMMPNPLSHTSQGSSRTLLEISFILYKGVSED